ncbi:rhomboid family intramembrane serine protease [Quadrisphaera sp. DSM 44207]|uniref:rhomboid family intramembrane serine protease n=1 Tax=Quadrisphaera sp. DSM 44207 TaxID=1881057 RepID=UPI0008823731|nr:rhomboid family intramembrane serine protease [Quadrisphaera sp. DSM 44207]SDQ22906.1 Membrane associated serine protease, rhomboid family [Quadrisphaera sp. DSM 44207]
MTQPVPAPVPPPVPVCPRHRDRESYVRCQRCERPACPQCQRQAPVGVQCVDCVAEAARTAPRVRTAFGGRVRGGWPVVTLGVVGLCVAAYVLQLAPGSSVTALLAFRPDAALAEPWRFVTAAFLHSPAGIFHILFNMYALWLTGPYLEDLLGRLRFAALYLVSAVGGSVGSLLLASPDAVSWYTASVGASGAVFGLFAALVVVQRRLGRSAGQVVAIIAVNGVLGFVLPNVAWQAHLGGLVTGAALAAVLVHAPRRRRAAAQAAGVAAVLAVLVLCVVVKSLAVHTVDGAWG